MCCNHTATQQEQLRVIGNDYGGISNLSFLKIFKKNVYKQPDECLSNHSIYDEYQSGFRSNHSTEAAPAKVINDLQINSDSQRVAVLLLLDLTAAFDTADRDILI